MFVAYTVVAILLAIGLTFSAYLLVTPNPSPQIVEMLKTVHVPRSMYAPLAALKLAGALILLIGIFWRPLGIAAAIGLVLYFLGAVIIHLRAKDTKGARGPVILILACVAALLRATTSS
ncbi:DoxX family protein [Nonomuraea sp. NPDC048916]|uniref:DoxX family protein n=1 Tax=Nonomuraea sp. NPDC048916 TaxID=3154232 RepID=UPI0033D6105F